MVFIKSLIRIFGQELTFGKCQLSIQKIKSKEVSEEYCDNTSSVEHRFDSYMKISLKHRTWTAFREYWNKVKRFQEVPWDEYLENTVGRYDKYPSEEDVVQIGKFSVDFCGSKLNELLQRLPKRFQTVVILHIVYEMSYEEIAEKLNMNHSTVRDYKSRGICLLRKYLKESGNETEQGENSSR